MPSASVPGRYHPAGPLQRYTHYFSERFKALRSKWPIILRQRLITLTFGGLAYSHGGYDPLLDNDRCQIDAGLMKALGVNTIRVYLVDGTQDHDACMQTFVSQDIYVWVELPTPMMAINRTNPSWTINLYTNWTATIDAFAKYDNLLTLGIGNEIIDEVEAVVTASYVKAAARDIKAFRDARQYRKIPIAYSAADVQSLRVAAADYLSCGQKADTIELYGLNLYSWCGNSSVYAAGYDTLYEEFEHSDIPVMFSETRCNTVARDFSDVATMLGTVFPALFSGAIVYEWAEEASDYGIVGYNSDDDNGYPTTLSGYNALKTVLANASPVGTSISAYTPSNSPPACPTSNTEWPLNADDALPTIAGLNIGTVTPAAVTSHNFSTGTASASVSTATSKATGNTDGDSSKRSEVLSKATIVGISVGVATAVVVAAAMGAFYVVRRRSLGRRIDKFSATSEDAGSMEKDMSEFQKFELPAVSSARIVPKSELEGNTSQHVLSPVTSVGIQGRSEGVSQELPNPQKPSHPVEMEGSSPTIQELDTTNNIGKSTSI